MSYAPPILRAVAVMLTGDGVEAIEDQRRRYDPFASLLPAHLTLVFPFARALPSPEHTYLPHVTVGRLPDPDSFHAVLARAPAQPSLRYRRA